MAILPGHDELAAAGTYSEKQLLWISLSQGILILLTILSLLWLCMNVYKILYRQRKWKVLPLVNFYVLAALLILIDLTKVYWFMKFTAKHNVPLYLGA
mmetsp:Transcript_25144/g.31544  ORF Transcript_25144/g.31544 Transcript_25144/m.31544 type:complete len:98 (+) Transcript_25144:8-301(+)